jgi:hypothetical protein
VLTTKTSTQIAGPATLNSSGSYSISVKNGSGEDSHCTTGYFLNNGPDAERSGY